MHRLNAIKRNSFSFRYCIINIYCRPRVYDEEIKDKLNVADTISFSLLMFLFNINLATASVQMFALGAKTAVWTLAFTTILYIFSFNFSYSFDYCAID